MKLPLLAILLVLAVEGLAILDQWSDKTLIRRMQENLPTTRERLQETMQDREVDEAVALRYAANPHLREYDVTRYALGVESTPERVARERAERDARYVSLEAQFDNNLTHLSNTRKYKKWVYWGVACLLFCIVAYRERCRLRVAGERELTGA